MQVPWPAAAGADGERSGQMRFGAGREGGHLLVADMHPLDLGLAANGIGQAVEAVANNTIDSFDTRRGNSFRKLVCNSFHIVFFILFIML